MTAGPPGQDATGPSIRPFLGGNEPKRGPEPRHGAESRPGDRPGLAGPADRTGVRPYVLTSGRVYDAASGIGPETQVVTRFDRPATILSPELAAIVEACIEPLSVAEISARLRLHLGVTRVLVSDLQAAGAVHVHTWDSTEPHSPETILRVMRGLRAIR